MSDGTRSKIESSSQQPTITETAIPYNIRKQIIDYSLNILTILGLFIVLGPIFWMVSTAFRSPSIMFNQPAPLLPPNLSLENFESLILQSDFLQYYINSIVVAIGAVLVSTTFATLGGYGLTRIEIPMKKSFARLILFGYMFPAILLAIPMFIFWRRLGLINSYIGLIFAESAIILPFCLWIMWKFFETVPISLEESAQMSGASRFRAFYEIALPVAKPGIIAVAIFSFASSWNAYTIPKIIAPNSEMWPLTIGLQAYVAGNKILWGELMAACVLILVPPFLFIFYLQKYLLEGFGSV